MLPDSCHLPRLLPLGGHPLVMPFSPTTFGTSYAPMAPALPLPCLRPELLTHRTSFLISSCSWWPRRPFELNVPKTTLDLAPGHFLPPSE